MDQNFANIIRKLEARKRANNGLISITSIDEASSTVAYADDLIEMIRVLDQRLTTLESKIKE